MIQVPSADGIHIVQVFLEQGKFWFALAGVAVAANKAFNWVKDIRNKDLKELHASVDSLSTKIDTQTTQVVNELKEMRADLRTLYISPALQMMPVRSRPVAKPKRVVKKKVVAITASE